MDNFLGYAPFAPQYAIGGYNYSQAAPDPTTSATVPTPAAITSGTSVGASANFAVSGWLAALIVGLAAYRYLWEKAE